MLDVKIDKKCWKDVNLLGLIGVVNLIFLNIMRRVLFSSITQSCKC